MIQAVKKPTEVTVEKPQKIEHLLTFQEYLEYVPESDVRYELVRGKLIPMPEATHLHTNICKFLIYKLQRYFAAGNLDLVANALATGVRTEENTSRIPDVVVFSKTVWEQVIHRPGAGVLDFSEQPILVVEVVSSNRRDDYVVKRDEYEIAKIPSYWIVDPKKKLVRVFTKSRNKEGYTFVDFTVQETIVSSEFDQLVLSVKELLNPPIVEELIKEEQTTIKTLAEQAEKEHQRAENERLRAETLEQRAETEHQRAETLEQQVETLEQRAETERQQAEKERQRAETLEQQVETERQRAEKLAQRLLEMGINPEVEL